MGAGDTVFDIGAHIGSFSIPLARMVAGRGNGEGEGGGGGSGADGKVIAFEPQRRLYDLLNTNAALNGLTNIRARRVVLTSPDDPRVAKKRAGAQRRRRRPRRARGARNGVAEGGGSGISGGGGGVMDERVGAVAASGAGEGTIQVVRRPAAAGFINYGGVSFVSSMVPPEDEDEEGGYRGA